MRMSIRAWVLTGEPKDTTALGGAIVGNRVCARQIGYKGAIIHRNQRLLYGNDTDLGVREW